MLTGVYAFVCAWVCVHMLLYMKLSFHEVSFKISWDTSFWITPNTILSIHICSSYLYVHISPCALYIQNIFHLPAYFKYDRHLFEQTKQGQSHLVKRWRKLSCAEPYCTIFLHLLCGFGLLKVHREKLHYTHFEVATLMTLISKYFAVFHSITMPSRPWISSSFHSALRPIKNVKDICFDQL